MSCDGLGDRHPNKTPSKLSIFVHKKHEKNTILVIKKEKKKVQMTMPKPIEVAIIPPSAFVHHQLSLLGAFFSFFLVSK